MRFRSLAALSVFSVALLASGAASATPTLTIDGITIPLGSSGSTNGSAAVLKSTESSFETQVVAAGQVLQGFTQVSLIQPNGSSSNTYSMGAPGALYLVGVFDNFKVQSVPSGPGDILFTGGTLTYYVTTTPIFDSSNSFATNLANITSAAGTKLFLSLEAEPIDGSDHTLDIKISGSPSNVTGASTNAYLNVTGGDAAAAFDTNQIADSSAPGGFVDAYYTGVAAQTLCFAQALNCVPFPITGSNDLYANTVAVPEPVSISLFGGGLAAMGAFVRRRKAKKA